MWAMEQKLNIKIYMKKMEVCNVERARETEMEGGGEEWRWMERHWITAEGQAGFTMGCHGSRIMLGSFPWEKLWDEGQRLQSVKRHRSKDRHPYYQLPLHQRLHMPGEVEWVPPGECVYSMCVRACTCTTRVTKQRSDVNNCLPSMLSHKGNKYNGAAG